MAEKLEKKAGTVYFTTAPDINLYNWVLDEAMPEARFNSFSSYMVSLVAAEWERKNMPIRTPIDTAMLARLTKMEENLLSEIRTLQSAVPPPTLPEQIQTDNRNGAVPVPDEVLAFDFSTLVDDDEEWDS